MENLLQFITLTKQFRSVKRRIEFKDGTNENDAEHSYQLAMTAWYIIEANNLKLDVGLVMKYALAHDLVEVYAGDTPSEVHKEFEGERNTKHQREEEAAHRLQKEFVEFAGLHDIIERYEKREDEESKLVYALDKIMPILNIYLEDGHSWRKFGVKVDDVIKYKKDKIAESPTIQKYFDMLVPLIKNLPDLS